MLLQDLVGFSEDLKKFRNRRAAPTIIRSHCKHVLGDRGPFCGDAQNKSGKVAIIQETALPCA